MSNWRCSGHNYAKYQNILHSRTISESEDCSGHFVVLSVHNKKYKQYKNKAVLVFRPHAILLSNEHPLHNAV